MKIILFGMIIGIANIIPGVSGGTMAVILKIYDKIIDSISNLRTKPKSSIEFLAKIGIGAGIGIVLFANVIDFCLQNFEIATNCVFVGLILGSIPMIKNKIDENNKTKSGTIVFAISFLIMLSMKINISGEDAQIIRTLSAISFTKLFVASFFSAGSMIIPGISGSFILLLLGAYTSVLTAISERNILILIPVGLGCMAGVLVCAKVIDILFKNLPYQTYMAILGLMIGSIVIIAPAFVISVEFIVGIILAILSAKVAIEFSKR